MRAPAPAVRSEVVPTVLDIEQALLLLELEPPFDKRDVQLARRRLAKVWHPDLAPPGKQLEHERHLKAINEAADQLERLAEGSRGGKVSRNAVKVSAAAARAARAEEGRRAYEEEQRQREQAADRAGNDPFGSRVPDHSVVHRYARCLSYPEWGVGTVTGIYFTGDGDDIQQWARVRFQPGVRTVPAGSLQFVDFSKPDPGAERVQRFMTAAQHAMAEGDYALAAQRLIYARDAEPAQPRGPAADDARLLAGRRPARRRARRARLGARRGRAARHRTASPRASTRTWARSTSRAEAARRAPPGRAPQDADAWERVGRLRLRLMDRAARSTRSSGARPGPERRRPARPRARPPPRRRPRRRGHRAASRRRSWTPPRPPRGRATPTRSPGPTASPTRSRPPSARCPARRRGGRPARAPARRPPAGAAGRVERHRSTSAPGHPMTRNVLRLYRLGDLIVALVAAAGLALIAAPGSAHAAEPGVNVDGVSPGQAMGDASALGAGWVRKFVRWDQLEHAGPGILSGNWVQESTIYVGAAQARGLKVVATVVGAPPWANGSQDPYVPPADPATYARFMGGLASRYRGRVSAWEIWNEPDGSSFWHAPISAPEYGAMLRASTAPSRPPTAARRCTPAR